MKRRIGLLMKRLTRRIGLLVKQFTRVSADLGVYVGGGMLLAGLWLIDARLFWVLGGVLVAGFSILTAPRER